jgi:HK97 gp10 family phage protein
MKVYGLFELAQGLRDLEQELVGLGPKDGQKALRAAGRKAFKPVLDAAKAKAPIDTGLLRDHIRIVTQAPKDGAGVAVVGLRIAKAKTGAPDSERPLDYQSPHWRWHFIEKGTSKKAARPFLRPALDENADVVVTTLKGELAKVIERVRKRRAKAAGAAQGRVK